MAEKKITKKQTPESGGASFLEQLAGNYTRFLLNGEEYAIKTEFVVSVLQKPTIRFVPKAPDFIEGIANIDGKILPILNPFIRFDIQKQSDKNELFLLMIKLEGITYGILTEEITGNNHFNATTIELVNPLIKKKESPFIVGVSKFEDQLVYLLDLQGFIFAGFEIERNDAKSYKEFVKSRNLSIGKNKSDNFSRYLLMSVSNQEYCLEIDKLETVIAAQQIELNKTKDKLLYGVINFMDQVIPVLDLQTKFSLTPRIYNKDSRIVIFKSNAVKIGIIVNEVKEIININPDEIKSAPEIFDNDSHIKGVGMLDNAERLVVLLNEDKLVNKNEMTEFDKLAAQNKTSVSKTTTSKELKKLMLIFNVNEIEFALPLEKVREVINMQSIKEIPKAPNYIKGVFSYRGNLATALDLGKRLDLKGIANEKYLIVIEHDQVTLGIATDKIEEILEVSKSSFKTPPKIVKGVNAKYMEQLIAIPNTSRTPIVLNVEQVMLK